MTSKADVERRIAYAESVIKGGGKTDGLWDDISNAIYNCPDLGDTPAKNTLMLIIDYHLEQFYRHAEPEARSLDELGGRPKPEPGEITWHR